MICHQNIYYIKYYTRLNDNKIIKYIRTKKIYSYDSTSDRRQLTTMYDNIFLLMTNSNE